MDRGHSESVTRHASRNDQEDLQHAFRLRTPTSMIAFSQIFARFVRKAYGHVRHEDILIRYLYCVLTRCLSTDPQCSNVIKSMPQSVDQLHEVSNSLL